MLTSQLPPRARRVARIWALVAIVVLAAMAGNAFFGLGGTDAEKIFGSWVFSTVIVGAAVGCVVRVVRVPEGRRIWAPLTIGLASYAVGTVIWSFWLQYWEEPPYPSVCDVLWLALYPGAYLTAVRLIRSARTDLPAGGWLDGIIAGLAVAAVGVAFVYDAVVGGATGSVAAIVVNFAYPFFDIVLIALVRVRAHRLAPGPRAARPGRWLRRPRGRRLGVRHPGLGGHVPPGWRGQLPVGCRRRGDRLCGLVAVAGGAPPPPARLGGADRPVAVHGDLPGLPDPRPVHDRQPGHDRAGDHRPVRRDPAHGAHPSATSARCRTRGARR